MHRTSLVRYGLLAAVAFGLAACGDEVTPPSLDPSQVKANPQESPPGQDLTGDDELERQIPGFGGFFFDRDGAPTVYLTRGNGRGPAEQALARRLSARGLSVASLRVREAKYAWGQLKRWQDAATLGAFDVPGTVFVDNDERINRITIGVENLSAIGQIRAALAQRGLPDDAVVIERAEPIVPVAGLQDRDRPVRAGVQINFPGFLCSVGFNVMTADGPGFITASHCTNTQGGTENTPYWQPTSGVDRTQIATEADDPAYTKGGPQCPKGRSCRRSDASRANYINSLASNNGFGKIAKTTGVNNGSLTIAGTFLITADDCDSNACADVGQDVDKIGRTTGWTRGELTQKCVNTGVQGSRIVQLCQNFVSAKVGSGDSGSDVFQVLTDTNGGGTVRLSGVLWGGSSSGTQFVYSPLANVRAELKAFTTH
jgi:hypothetical protein